MRFVAKDIFSKLNYTVSLNETQFRAAPSEETQTEDIFISPGWVDIQVNGFAGHDLNSDDVEPETVSAMVQRLWQVGITTVLPTVITGLSGAMERRIKAVVDARKANKDVAASVVGLHLEGPHISPEEGARGAHPKEHVRPPTVEEFDRFQRTAEGLIRLVTLAPEVEGAVQFIRELVYRNIVVALGHSLASEEEIAEAAAAGARLSTHLGNGIPALLPRHPNPIWSQLADDRLYASAIFDGHHLPSSVMKVLVRVKKSDKLILTSDAVALAGMSPGVYETPVGGKVELHPDGRLTMYGTNYLAGSANALSLGIENAVKVCGCSLREAVRMVTHTPLKLLGLEDPGHHTLFRWTDQRGLEVLATVIADKVVFLSRNFNYQLTLYPTKRDKVRQTELT